ncbi:MAG TPA: ABC transporter substrate-binding protein [Burkholderiales bacterium]|nr:ABC transporter substrate-binding protein [Burkholderiales bacterium]
MEVWNAFQKAGAAVLGLSFAALAAAEPGITADKIIIGQAAGFTGSVAGTVRELTAGAQLYFDHVNAKGGVHGRRIVLESMDDGFDPKRSPDVFKKLIEEKQVFAMFLSRGTPTNEAAYPVLEAAKVPLVGPSTGAMSMYDPPRKYLFPVRASYQSETFKIVPQLVNMGMTRIALLYVDDSFGKDGLAGVQQAMKEAKLTPVAVVSHQRGSTKLEEAVAAVAKADPQAVIMVTLADAGVAFVKQMKAAGKSPMFLTLSNNSSNAFIKNLGDDGHGLAVSQVSPYPFSGSEPLTREFLGLIKDKKDLAPSYSSMEGFIAAKVLVEGLRRAGKQPTREKLIAGLESMKAYDLGGVDVTYGPNLRTGTSYIDLTIIGKTGKFVR